MTVKFTIAVDLVDSDGDRHRIGVTHAEKQWRCFCLAGKRCPHISAARKAADKELPR